MENKAIPTYHNGIVFRSKNEARWALFFDFVHIEYNYEPRFFTVGRIQYRPDFYLPKYDKFAEVKSSVDGIQNSFMAQKLNCVIDYQATEISKGLLLLGAFPYDIRTINTRLKTKWLFWHEGVCCANAYIQQEGSSDDAEILFTKENIDTGDPLPPSASPDIFVEQFSTGVGISLAINKTNSWFSHQNDIFNEIHKANINIDEIEIPF